MRAQKRRQKTKMMSKPEVIKTFVSFLFKTRLVCKHRLINVFVAEIVLSIGTKKMSFRELKYKTHA